jgi:hypothetical protein
MRTYLPKMLLFFAVIASIFLFFACSSRQGSTSEREINEQELLDSSSSNPPQDNDPSSSSAIVSSSAVAVSSSSVNSSNSATISSSSSVRSSSSARLSSSATAPSSSSARSSSSATAPSSSSARSSSSIRSSSSATTPSSSSVTVVPLPVGPISCTRAGLESAVNSYLAAIAAGDYTKMSLASDAKYYENDHDAKQNYSTGKYDKEVKFGEGLWKTPLKVDFHRNLIDVDSCATYTEIIVANSDPQYVLGARLDVKDSKISKVTLVVTQKGDWGFNAKNYLSYSTKEDWSELPVAGRRTREQLRIDSYAYLAYFDDSTKVNPKPPWAKPCARLEGGAYTGDGGCNVGIPQKTPLKPVSYLADVDYGMVVVFLFFGGADSHWFRILPTGYRYIHTLTAMKQSDYQAPR